VRVTADEGEGFPVKKRLVTAAVGTAIALAAVIPAGSAFAAKAPRGPAAKAARCAVLLETAHELQAEATAATDPVDKAIIQALANSALAKYNANCP
jgi:hypothetical protein